MTRDEITNIVEKNLAKIHVGDKFPTQQKLFTALNIPNDGNGNKTARSIVSLYVNWERIDNNSKEIRVIKVIEKPTYIDGRKNNGGAHNEKYGMIIKPTLLTASYKTPVTYTYIFENIYGFGKNYFKNRFTSQDKHKREYFDFFKNYLKSITKNALNGLQRNNYLNYKEVYMIKYGNRRRIGSDWNFNEDTLLVDFLENIWGDHYQIDLFIKFLDSAISENERREAGIDAKWGNISLLNLVKLIVKKRGNHEFIKRFDEFTVPAGGEPVIAERDQEEMIATTEDTLCKSFGYNRKVMSVNSARAARVYIYAGVIYKLWG